MSESTLKAPATSGWSVEQFEAFWTDPDPELVQFAVTEDVVGDWPGDREHVRGVEAYTARITQVLARAPDLKLRVAEHAQNGEFVFVRWIAHATGKDGSPVEFTGMDRIRLCDGLVAENIIRYDPGVFDEVFG